MRDSDARWQPFGATGPTRVPLVMWLATAAFIVYGTTIPFNFAPSLVMVREHLARVTLNPLISPETGHRVSIPDFTSNILLFTPFGCFGVWSLRRLRSRVAKVLLLTLLSFALSASVETIQLFTIDRTTSVADVFANTVGGAFGAAGGVVLGATVGALVRAAAAAGLTDSIFLFPLITATCVMLAGAWQPFDVTLDVGSVIPKLKAFLHDPVQFGPLTDEVLSFLQHALFSATLMLWLREMRVRSAAAAAMVIGVVAACVAEGSQLFIGARMPGLWDAAIGSAGALAGVPLATAFAQRRSARPWCAALVAITIVGVAMQQLSPFTLGGTARGFQWMPFRNYYDFTTSETVSHSAELLLSYIPLGFGLALAWSSSAARRIGVFAIALAIAVPIEYLQQFVGGRFPDVTDIAMSIGGAAIGGWLATGGWRLFSDEMRLIAHSTGTMRPPALGDTRSAEWRPAPTAR